MIKKKLLLVVFIAVLLYGCQGNANVGNTDVDPTISESGITTSEEMEQQESTEKNIEESDLSDSQLSLNEIFVSEVYGFEFKYPSSWKIEESAYWEADENRESAPSHGAKLSITDDEDEYFNIMGRISPLGSSFESGIRSDFITDSGMEGDEYIELVDDQVWLNLVLDRGDGSQWPMGKGYHGAILRIDKDVFYQNEESIRAVLKSITIYEIDP